MSMKVIHPGLSTAVQDLGRYGFQQHGVTAGGAMDSLATKTANVLVGNDEDEAVLEIVMKGPKLLCRENMLVAICGADMSPTIDGKPISLNRPVWIKKGSLLQFGTAKKGFRAYLAAAGGWDVPLVLGSRSTNIRAKFGGFQGRSLKEGDLLTTRNMGDRSRHLTQLLAKKAGDNAYFVAEWYIPENLFPSRSEHIVRVMRGEHFETFQSQSQRDFFSQEFQVTPQSDRMGYRLAGPMLEQNSPLELISSAVSAGTIQVPPNGQPIVLLADRQTIGGYPKIGHVATVDLPILAQMRPGETLRFQEISLQEAHQALYNRELALQRVRLGMELHVGWR